MLMKPGIGEIFESSCIRCEIIIGIEIATISGGGCKTHSLLAVSFACAFAFAFAFAFAADIVLLDLYNLTEIVNYGNLGGSGNVR